MNSVAVNLHTLITHAYPTLKNKDFIPHPLNELYDIIMHHVHISKADCIAYPDTPITSQQYNSIMHAAQQRKEGKPLAYIVGNTDFYGRPFFVNESVLIPRPESERLVDLALTFMKRMEYAAQKKEWHGSSFADTCALPELHTYSMLDCGTGSGCIGLSIAAELQSEHSAHSWTYMLTDISQEALVVAEKNTRALLSHSAQEQVLLIHDFLFHARNGAPSIIVSNLPYVSPVVFSHHCKHLRYEPEIALKGSLETQIGQDASTIRAHNAGYDDGTVLIRQLLQASSALDHPHIVLLEADPLQMDVISCIATCYAYTIQGIFHDTFHYPRFFYCAK